MRCCSRLLVSIVVLLVLVAAIATVPDPAACRKWSPGPVEVIDLPELPGGACHLDCVSNIPWKFLTHQMSGQTREIGGPWQACVWTSSQMGGAVCVSTLETLPSLDVTRDAGANHVGFAINDNGGDPDTSIVATGFSYDALGRIQPILWTRLIPDSSFDIYQLPALAGLEGEVLAFQDGFPQGQTIGLVGWSSATGPVEKAVVWTPTGTGGWAVRMLSHYAAGLPGRAHDGFVSATAETTICGWAEDSSGDTTAVVWRRSVGAWSRTALPLLAGGAQGMALSIIDGEGSGNWLVGWSENSLGERRAVRWYDSGGWQVQELEQLAGYSQSVARGGQVCPQGDFELIAVGRSYDLGAPRATIWGILGQQGNDFARDLNELVISDNPPTLTAATGVGLDANDMLLIAANGAAGQPGLYSTLQAGDPHAYLLIETELVPALSSHGSVALLAVVLAALALAKRRRWAVK